MLQKFMSIDGCMEITSPDGMFNGGRIQDMDLNHVPSVRRNEVISDIFGRLNYMDRCGSGIGRIIDSYTGYAQKPSFYSDEFTFSVILPNRSVYEPERTEESKSQLSEDKTQLSGEKTQLTPANINYKQGWEANYFTDLVLKRLENKYWHKMLEQIHMLFARYRYQYTFDRRNVADMFGITENGASIRSTYLAEYILYINLLTNTICCDIIKKPYKML